MNFSLHLLFIGLMLIPAGVFPVIKIILVLSFVLLNWRMYLTYYSKKNLIYIFSFLCLIFLYSIPTVFFNYPIEHMFQLLSIAFVTYLMLTLVELSNDSDLMILKRILISYIVWYAFLKILIFGLFLSGFFNYKDAGIFLGNIGFVFQDFSWWGFPGIVRITATNDFILACTILLYVIFDVKLLSKLAVFIISFALIISFSRLFIFIALIAIVHAFIIQNSRNRILLLILISFIFLFIDWSAVYDLFAFRFSDSTSDDTKIKQTYLLLDSFINSHGIGFGSGFYLTDYIRSETEPFTYENHIVQILMQIGFLGLFILLYPYFYSSLLIERKNNFSLLIYLSTIIFFNLTNPYFNSITSPLLILLNFSLKKINKYESNK